MTAGVLILYSHFLYTEQNKSSLVIQCKTWGLRQDMLKGIFILITNLYLNCNEFTLYSQQMCKHVMCRKKKPWQLQLNKHFVLQGGSKLLYTPPDLVVSYHKCGVMERKSIVVVCLWNLALFFLCECNAWSAEQMIKWLYLFLP